MPFALKKDRGSDAFKSCQQGYKEDGEMEQKAALYGCQDIPACEDPIVDGSRDEGKGNEEKA